MDPERMAQVGERVGQVIFDASMARQKGELGTAAELHGEAVTLFALLEQWNQAQSQAAQALALYEELGDTAKAARARYALGSLEAQASGGTRTLEATLKRAQEAGDPALVAKSAEKLAGVALKRQDYRAAGRYIELMAGAHADQGEVLAVVDDLRMRSFVFQLQGRPADAYTCISRALSISKQSGETARMLEMRLDLHMLTRHPLLDDDLRPEELDRLIDDAAAAEHPGMVGYARLARATAAIEAERVSEALPDAEAGRQAALEALDPTLYLMACLMIAEIQEKLGDRLKVLTILFTCQASLGDLLGEAAKAPVLQVITSLEERWGKTEFDDWMTRYRAQFEHQP